MRLRPVPLFVGLACVFASACAKDPAIGGAETGTGSTGTDTASDEVGSTDTSTSTSTDTSTDEGATFVANPTETETGDPVEPLSCQEMLDCVFMCLGDLGSSASRLAARASTQPRPRRRASWCCAWASSASTRSSAR